MKPTLEITKCHEDVQHGATSDGQHGNLLRYVATYSMKASSSLEEEWLSGGGAAQNVAAGLLRGLRIMAPEMVLTLAQERFPQVQLSGTVVDIMAPTFDMACKPWFVTAYENSDWRPDDMTLLEFLRKANKEGDIIRYIRQKHTEHVMQQAQTVLSAVEKGKPKKTSMRFVFRKMMSPDSHGLVWFHRKAAPKYIVREQTPVKYHVYVKTLSILQAFSCHRAGPQVQACSGEDDQTFATTRRMLLSAWNQHKRESKMADEEPASLVDFLAAEEGYEGLTPLEAFAKEYQTRGEKLIAATMFSRLNDKFYA